MATPLARTLTIYYFKFRTFSAWKAIETETRFQIFFIQNGMGIFTKEDTSHGQRQV